MKVTKNNIKEINLNHNDLELLNALLDVLQELNQELIDLGELYMQLYIDYEDTHTEYSPERVDPCPDYYGMFTLRFEKNQYETVGDYMTLEELDQALLILCNFVEFKLS